MSKPRPWLNQFRNESRKTIHTSVDCFSLGEQWLLSALPGAYMCINYFKWCGHGEEAVRSELTSSSFVCFKTDWHCFAGLTLLEPKRGLQRYSFDLYLMLIWLQSRIMPSFFDPVPLNQTIQINTVVRIYLSYICDISWLNLLAHLWQASFFSLKSVSKATTPSPSTHSLLSTWNSRMPFGWSYPPMTVLT